MKPIKISTDENNAYLFKLLVSTIYAVALKITNTSP